MPPMNLPYWKYQLSWLYLSYIRPIVDPSNDSTLLAPAIEPADILALLTLSQDHVAFFDSFTTPITLSQKYYVPTIIAGIFNFQDPSNLSNYNRIVKSPYHSSYVIQTSYSIIGPPLLLHWLLLQKNINIPHSRSQDTPYLVWIITGIYPGSYSPYILNAPIAMVAHLKSKGK